MNEARAHQLAPCRTVVTSFNPRKTPTSGDYFDDGDWVLSVLSSPTYISCAQSNGEIQVYDPRRLHVVYSFPRVHDGMITDLVGAPPQQNADHILVSSGTDGRVCVLDLRQQQQQHVSFSLPHSHEQALSVSMGYDGNLAAVGSSKAKIHFFDLRQASAPLGSYVNSHTDEVTRVRFQHAPEYNFSASSTTSTAGCLLSGSEDGLACVFDTTQPSEEAALKSVMNAQTSLRHVGFFGPNLEGVYCLTGSETLSLWNWDAAQCLADCSDIRQTLGVDYLTNAHWDHRRNELAILAGCANGDACLSAMNVTQSNPTKLHTSHRLAGGHRGVVRDWCPISAGLLVSVGEDARMCEWNLTGRQSNATGKVSVTQQQQQQQQTVQRRGSGASQQQQQQPGSLDSSRRNGNGPLRRQRNKRTVNPY
ncbi:WD repeat-containing protein 89 [Seminavis robusta]|uniref:WD repeat-containing protein 89 n=1 Tax=Seminavis robusta TaxID=568900 RepID=A0A9N8DCV8_9STRA|nr:WD repeat-containing protein 89 [Seminavis robusta]|eukprot:Sro88_g046630.1 WD repeat-containing protein 89 (420) ;mRNA; r:84212-85471